MILRVLTISSFIILLVMGRTLALEKDVLGHAFEGIQEKYGTLSSFTVAYTREVITRSMVMLGTSVKGDTAKGQIYFKSPDFIRLEQKIPRLEILATDGDILWWYIPEKAVAYKYPSKKFGKELSLLANIFQGHTCMGKSFEAEITEIEDEQGFKLTLKPVPPWEEVDRIVITLTTGFNITALDIYNSIGGITRFRLDNPIQVEALNENFFRLTVPEEVKVIPEGFSAP